MRRNRAGFTLIELMVAAAMALFILGVITFTFNNASGVTKRALALTNRFEQLESLSALIDNDFRRAITGGQGTLGLPGLSAPLFDWNPNGLATLRFNVMTDGRGDYDGAAVPAYQTVTYTVTCPLYGDVGGTHLRRWELRRAAGGGAAVLLHASPWFPDAAWTGGLAGEYHPLLMFLQYEDNGLLTVLPADYASDAVSVNPFDASATTAGRVTLSLVVRQVTATFDPDHATDPGSAADLVETITVNGDPVVLSNVVYKYGVGPGDHTVRYKVKDDTSLSVSVSYTPSP